MNTRLKPIASKHENGRIAVYVGATQPRAVPTEPEEMSSEFTDSARAAIAWVLYHHQGGSSPIGQPLRFALGMGAHERLPDWRIAEAKRWAERCGATTEQFHRQPVDGVADGPLTGRYAEVLAPFLAMMDRELHANSGKGDRPGWLSMDRKTALLEIFYHLAKLQKAAKNDDLAGVREFSADVANMSMMLADICGVLTAAPAPGQNGGEPCQAN